MNERRQDFELLQRFARHGEQSAFADVVRRHLDLVFATALRKLEDPGAAQEVAQNVFTVLARKAWRFAPDDSLPAWLYKTALLESKSWLRGELRRRRREETAAELGTTMKTPNEQPAFNALVQLLDEALLSLREKDRTALLLRFYESLSLRDVGVSLGVGEDAAQKRVQGALEKLSQFFQHRGFKTVTVAASAAALQHTAASASAATASAVVSFALAAAPPALAGLTALLARLASLSTPQVAALCLALAAVPVGLQLNERRGASEEARRIQTQLLATRNERATVQAEIERLRASSESLEMSLAKANESSARAAESTEKFEAWKRRIREQLTGAEYRWPEDSPLVRIPKSALPKLSAGTPILPPGVIKPSARKLMGLTPSERQTLEETLRRHFAEVEGDMEAGVYETNKPWRGSFPDTVIATKVFVVPALGDETKARADRVLADMRAILGEVRWPLVRAKLEEHGTYTLDQVLHLDVNKSAQQLLVWVAPGDKGTPTMGYSWANDQMMMSMNRGTLSMFLPDGDPNKTVRSEELGRSYLAEALRRRGLSWFEEQAISRWGKETKR
ncbi:MAG: sigma-70 family RNA polymerase sigma factor [Pedosphaera sp.]|nr:sigma-70 family RNA polymerase sigma factor [Pedosphaera sp.]